MPQDDMDLADVHFQFSRRPSPLPADLRAEWRLAAIALILKKCRGERATLKQLHVLNWAMRTAKSRDAFIKMLSHDRRLDDPVVRFEPSLNRAIALALAENLLLREPNGTIRLTEKGGRLTEEIMGASTCLAAEKEFLSRITGKVTQRQIDHVLSWNSD